MGKKSKKRANNIMKQNIENEAEFSEPVEKKFKLILRIMSWIVGICFTLIIILPNFEFFLIDEIVKILFFLGVLNLLLFAVLELFGTSAKKYLSRYYS